MPLWMQAVEWLARFILVGLVGLSVWSLSIILEKRKFLNDFDIENEFSAIKEQSKNLKRENIGQGLKRHFFLLRTKMQDRMSVLGTLGATAPFIGLFGTVLGIIVAFGELSMGNAGTNSIMFALAEALILTAFGLFVAIPAVVAFNTFNKKIKFILGDLESRLDDFLAKDH